MRVFIIATTLLLAMCGGKTDGNPNPNPTAPGADASAASLSTDQLKSLCDWEAGLFGGYGQEFGCDEGGTDSFHVDTGPTDQASCVANLSSQYRMCPVPLSRIQFCMQWAIANWCATTSPEPASCVTLFGPTCLPS